MFGRVLFRLLALSCLFSGFVRAEGTKILWGMSESSSDCVVRSWKPYWMYLNQPKKTPFFQASIGMGFLYFDGVRANFSPLPGYLANDFAGPAPFKRSLSYNRTPLFEYNLGQRFNSWFKIALSYQFQGGVTLQTSPLRTSGYSNTIPSQGLVQIFRANLDLNSLQLKTTFEYPLPLIWKGLGFNPYVGIGFGAGWQSFSNIQSEWIQTTTFNTNSLIVEQSFVQKTCSSVHWMVDVGLRIRSALYENSLFFLAGVKYNQWGSSRNLGKLSEQGASKQGLLNPFQIKTLYSFAPYLSAQWTFPTPKGSSYDLKIKGYQAGSFKPQWLSIDQFRELKVVWTSYNVGIGFLYFSALRGSLSSRPRDPINNLPSNVPIIRRGASYLRSPLSEFQMGFRLFDFLACSMSYQHQTDIAFASKPQRYINPNPALGLQNSTTYAELKSNLELDAVMGKLFFQLPKPLVLKSYFYLPYAAAGIGTGWMSWTQINVWRTTNNTNFDLMSLAQPLSDKICANLVWMLDIGLRVQSLLKSNHFSLFTGIKYIQWGSARNLGKQSQQGYRSYGLFPVTKIKTIYSFAPYLGVSWDYPIFNPAISKQTICGKDPNQLIPFFVPIHVLQPANHLSVEYNLGSGFLYFHKIRGVISQTPSANGSGYSQIGPLDRQLSYNRTPLYEFILGYRASDWLKFSLSYQTQRGMSISTKFMKSPLPSEINNAVEFRANLQLDSFMFKTYFELPWAIVVKNLANSIYIGAGTGGAWQSWTQLEYRLASLGARRSQYYQQKICASVALSADAGFRVQSISSKGSFCITKGIKYMQWGQARNLGDIKDQKALRTGLFQPLRVQVIYSFIPYLGIQWNY